MFRVLFRRTRVVPPAPRIPEGERVYAIGDVHGRLDCLDDLLHRIDADARDWSGRRRIVFLGDLVDRGPDSCGVVERVSRLVADDPDITCLTGNHEEILLTAVAGDRKMLMLFDRVGGRETLLSYGVPPDTYEAADLTEVRTLAEAAIPAAHLDFLGNLPDQVAIGDYRFVHAGIRPGIPLDQQSPGDLRWIRREFLSHTKPFDAMIVHGHTITEAPDIQPNRIGIDTGAYATGILTALVLEDDGQRFLSTSLSRSTVPAGVE